MSQLNRYEPWNVLSQLHGEIDRLFDTRPPRTTAAAENQTPTSDWVPAVDVKEKKDKYVIRADVPGVEPKDIQVTMENGVLSISGNRASEKRDENESYKRVERAYGSFFRRFTLPDSVAADKITAKGKNGVLEIVIPKSEPAKSRRIAIEE